VLLKPKELPIGENKSLNLVLAQRQKRLSMRWSEQMLKKAINGMNSEDK
jgi:hypothetical protein